MCQKNWHHYTEAQQALAGKVCPVQKSSSFAKFWEVNFAQKKKKERKIGVLITYSLGFQYTAIKTAAGCSFLHLQLTLLPADTAQDGVLFRHSQLTQ